MNAREDWEKISDFSQTNQAIRQGRRQAVGADLSALCGFSVSKHKQHICTHKHLCDNVKSIDDGTQLPKRRMIEERNHTA